jgi:hypothetical protein
MQKQFCQYKMPTCSLTTQGDVKCLKDKMTTAAFNSWPYQARDDTGTGILLKIEQPRPTLRMSTMFKEGFVNFPSKTPTKPLFDKGDMF